MPVAEKKFIRLFFGSLLFAAGFFMDLNAQSKAFSIHIQHNVAGKPLVLDSGHYKNCLGQAFTISKFKYYLGEFTLKQSNGASYTSPDYFLIDEEDSSSKQITLNNVPAGNYTAIEFIIGVDSLHNCSGAQSGALDPVNSMFWAWNTGYIFLKLEGNAAASPLPGHIFEYHIGGYRAPSNCIRKISLTIEPRAVKSGQLNLSADIMKLLEHKTVLDLGKLPAITDFHNATRVADNYSAMFQPVAEHEN